MRKKSKIMILHNIISPYRLTLFEELSKKYDLTVYFCKTNDKDRRWSTDLSKYSFKYKILPNKNIGPFVINPPLVKELNENDFDIYIFSENPENAFSIRKIIKFVKKNNKKIILWNERINDEVYSSKNLFKRLFYLIVKNLYKKYRNSLYHKADNFISFSEKSSGLLISNGVNTKVIHRAFQIFPKSLLPKPSWKSKPKEFKNKKIILYLGYLSERKGVDYLIKSFNKLGRKDTLLLIAGSGNEENKLKELAKDNKNIIFLGHKTGIEKANYYSISDFFVFPTLHDCWGLIVNEAFYYGIPIISTNKAGAIELIEEGKTGLIIPDQNIDALKSAMRKLLDDPKLLTKMKEDVKKIPKSKIVEINTTSESFEKAINYALNSKK